MFLHLQCHFYICLLLDPGCQAPPDVPNNHERVGELRVFIRLTEEIHGHHGHRSDSVMGSGRIAFEQGNGIQSVATGAAPMQSGEVASMLGLSEHSS